MSQEDTMPEEETAAAPFEPFEVWRCSARPDVQHPRCQYEGRRSTGSPDLPDEEVKRFADGSKLITAYGRTSAEAREAWATLATIELAKG